MNERVKVSKFGIHKSIPYSQLETYKKAGWDVIRDFDWRAYYQKRKEREANGD